MTKARGTVAFLQGSLAPRPITRMGSPVILTICAVLMLEAVLLVCWPSSLGATVLLALASFFHTSNTLILAAILWFFAIASAVATTCRFGWPRLLILLPQQFLIGVMAVGGIAATIEGRYLDFTAMPGPHILADQIGWLALFVVHAVGILHRSSEPDDD